MVPPVGDQSFNTGTFLGDASYPNHNTCLERWHTPVGISILIAGEHGATWGVYTRCCVKDSRPVPRSYLKKEVHTLSQRFLFRQRDIKQGFVRVAKSQRLKTNRSVLERGTNQSCWLQLHWISREEAPGACLTGPCFRKPGEYSVAKYREPGVESLTHWAESRFCYPLIIVVPYSFMCLRTATRRGW
jgi:hypothetical protein